MAELTAPNGTLTLSPYDLAVDLFGYPPRMPVVCPVCDELAEPFAGAVCWHCYHVQRAPSERWRELSVPGYLSQGY